MTQTWYPFKLFIQKFSGSSRVKNMNPHIKISHWTDQNLKRLTGSRAQTKNVKFSYQKNRTKFWPRWPWHHRRILLSKPDFQNRLYKPCTFMLQLFNKLTIHQHHHEIHHAPLLHVRSPKFWTLRAAQVPWIFWGLKPSGNRSFSFVFCSGNFKNSWFSWKFWNFITMSQTWNAFKLFTTNFLEALALKIWILTSKSSTGQKEIEDD